MNQDHSLTLKEHWLKHPQRLRFRKFLFHVHLWSGISLGLYIFFISLTGSVLVYRNELYVATTPNPIIAPIDSALALSEEALLEAVLLVHPGYELTRTSRARNDDRAVEVWLQNEDKTLRRFFDPRTGQDIGSAERKAQTMVLKLIELHESFLLGEKGRIVNGFGALFVLLIVFTGLVIWWPGIKRWRLSLRFRRGIGWKRQIWDIHSMVGIWSALAILVFALSGAYLCFPNTFHDFADRIQPITDTNIGERFVDKALYWLAFLHFGRINGIGILCSGPGICDQSVKAVWAVFGLAPAAMFLTGATMWWNRVLSHWLKPRVKSEH